MRQVIVVLMVLALAGGALAVRPRKLRGALHPALDGSLAVRTCNPDGTVRVVQEAPLVQEKTRSRSAGSAEPRLAYDVTFAAGAKTLGSHAAVHDVECGAPGVLVIHTSDPEAVLAWGEGTPIISDPHFTCGRSLAGFVAGPAAAVDLAEGVVSLPVRETNMTSVVVRGSIDYYHPPALRTRGGGEASISGDMFNMNYNSATGQVIEKELVSGSIACFDCYAYVEAGFNLKFEWTMWWVSLFEVSVTGEAKINGDLSVENPSPESDSTLRFTPSLTAFTWGPSIGGVTFGIKSFTELRAQTSSKGATSGRVTAGLTASASAELGVRYDGYGWAPIRTTNWAFDLREPQYFFGPAPDSSFKVFIVPRITFEIFDTVRIFVDVKPYYGVDLRTSLPEVTDPMSEIPNGPLGIPDPPTQLVMVSSTPSSITMNWTPPAAVPGEAVVTGYIVQYYECAYLPLPCSATAEPWVTAGWVSAPPAILPNLSQNTRYGIRVCADADQNCGGFSQEAVMFTTPVPPPSLTCLTPVSGTVYSRSSSGTNDGDIVYVTWSSTSLPDGPVDVEIWEDTFGADTFRGSLTLPVDLSRESTSFNFGETFTPSAFLYMYLKYNGGTYTCSSPYYFSVVASGSDAGYPSNSSSIVWPSRSVRAKQCETEISGYYGVALSAEVSPIVFSIPLFGDIEIMSGGPLFAIDLIDPQKLGDGTSCPTCSGCMAELETSSTWVPPDRQRGQPGALASPKKDDESSSRLPALIGAGVAVAFVVAAVAGVALWVSSRRRAGSLPEPKPSPVADVL